VFRNDLSVLNNISFPFAHSDMHNISFPFRYFPARVIVQEKDIYVGIAGFIGIITTLLPPFRLFITRRKLWLHKVWPDLYAEDDDTKAVDFLRQGIGHDTKIANRREKSAARGAESRNAVAKQLDNCNPINITCGILKENIS
jgi:hypothetical protein